MSAALNLHAVVMLHESLARDELVGTILCHIPDVVNVGQVTIVGIELIMAVVMHDIKSLLHAATFGA